MLSAYSETIRALATYLFATVVVLVTFWFLYQALLNPDTAALPDDSRGMVVTGCFSLLTASTVYVFQQNASASASRSSERAARAGAEAASSPTQTGGSGGSNGAEG